jgi:hypothetical protein
MITDREHQCWWTHNEVTTSPHIGIHKRGSNAQATGEQVASEASTQPPYHQLKLAMDVHADSIVVVRMAEGAKPQAPQTFKPADSLA